MDRINIPKILRLASKYFEDEPSEQALLTEYQVCQREKHSQASTYWTIAGIFFSFLTVFAGYLLTSELDYQRIRWLLLGFSIFSILIILLISLLLVRTNRIISCVNRRIDKIEKVQTSLKINQYIRQILKRKICKIIPLPTGHQIMCLIFIIVSLPWIFFLLAAIFSCVGRAVFN